MKIGVFDSGIGGEALAVALRKYFSDANVQVVNDREHVPYGNKSHAEILRLTEAAIQPLLQPKCDVIVIACNTATSVAIEHLRATYPTQRFIGIEPMIKTAASKTRSGIIGVCATPATLKSDRYKKLVKDYGAHLAIIEPDCSIWASMIEQNRSHELDIEKTIDKLCSAGADVIVLGCTHYHWIKKEITKFAKGRAVVIEPSVAICKRVESLLA